MANKTYTPQEAAIMVLKKAEELCRESSLAKAETGHEKGINTASTLMSNSKHGVSDAGNHVRNYKESGMPASELGAAVAHHKQTLGEMKAMPKPKLGKAEMPPWHKPGKDALPAMRDAIHNERDSMIIDHHAKEAMKHHSPGTPEHKEASQALSSFHRGMAKAEPAASPSPSPAPASSTEEYDPYTDPGIVNKTEHQPHPGPTSAVPGYQAAGQAQSEAHLKTPQGDAERKEGNAQRMKGHIKLAHFTGRMAAKRESMAKREGEKGVHLPHSETDISPGSKLKGDMGQSGVGSDAYNMKRSKEDLSNPKVRGGKRRDAQEDYDASKSRAVGEHKQVLAEMKQIKPKLPG